MPSVCCWGSLVQSKDAHECAARFYPGRRCFKSKFCSECRKRIIVSETRVRALTTAQEHTFYNTHGSGIWSDAPITIGVGNYRVINNTVGCSPPALVLFKGKPPDLAWHPMPHDWRLPTGLVELRIARGTLVPLASIRAPPVLRKVLVPSVAPMRLKAEPDNEDHQDNQEKHPFLAALGAFDNDDNKRGGACDTGDTGDENGDDENGDDENDDDDDDAAARKKKALRMKRNRESAATSRDRKRKYIYDLEQQVLELTATVKTLREENSLLGLLNLQSDDRSSPVSIDAAPLGACDVAFL